jgi:hypothetical protein
VAALPTIVCPRRVFAGLTANPEAEAWRGLPAEELRDAVTGAIPKQAATVKAAWDEAELRVFFDITDDHIWATQTQRDGPLWEEEVVEVFLDPVGDLEAYFEFEVNPLNAVLDLVARKNRSGYAKNFCWQCEGLRTAVSRHAGGWCAELAFPLAGLASELPRAGVRWRVNFCRIDRPPGVDRELTAWSPPRRGSFHTPERFGFLEFAE